MESNTKALPGVVDDHPDIIRLLELVHSRRCINIALRVGENNILNFLQALLDLTRSQRIADQKNKDDSQRDPQRDGNHDRSNLTKGGSGER